MDRERDYIGMKEIVKGKTNTPRAPSYFSQFFQFQIAEAERKGESGCNAIRTLYMDRDPATFRDISLHLQGYHVSPRDASHFVRLFADAQFYSRESIPILSFLHFSSILLSLGGLEVSIWVGVGALVVAWFL